MRAGLVASIIGHIGAVMMTMLAWEARSVIVAGGAAVVPVEIVDVADESNVRALAEEVPEEDLSPEAAEETAEAQPAPAPSPRPTPQPRRNQQQDQFDPEAVARMLNADSKTGRTQQEGQNAQRNQRGVGQGTADRVTVEARVAALVDRHLRRCWRMPDDLPDPDRLVVTLAFQLNRNGTLSGQPRVVSPRNYTFDAPMNEAVNRAMRAVRQCDPYTILTDDPIVGPHFDIWREQEVTFGRRQS